MKKRSAVIMVIGLLLTYYTFSADGDQIITGFLGGLLTFFGFSGLLSNN